MGTRRRLLIRLWGAGWALATLAFCAGIAVLVGRLVPARAQSLEEGRAWIHANQGGCCPHDRCFPVEISLGMTHWLVRGYQSEVRLGRERRWPFERAWGCAYQHDPTRIRCLFVPPQEQS